MAGKVKEKQLRRPGTYILGDGLVNGYPHWQKIDGSQAIWFDKMNSNWKVGPNDNLGTNTGGIAGPKGKDSYPNEIKQGWQFAPGFQDAGQNDVIFRVIGIYIFHTLTLQNQFIPFTSESIQEVQKLLLILKLACFKFNSVLYLHNPKSKI